MEGVADRRRKLYGADRNLKAQEISQNLRKSNLLQEGEYNYTIQKLKNDVWQTNFKRDFTGRQLDRSYTSPCISQIDHHFRLGNDSGVQLPAETYQGSTTKEDFGKKDFLRPQICAADRTVNWPDMAPRYMTRKDMGKSEYNNTFMMENLGTTRPVFPKVVTSRMKLPLDPTRFWVQRDSNVKFGDDERSAVSEHQRSFGRTSEADLAITNHVKDVKQTMKDMDMKSHVFRDGDYNGHVNDYLSTTVGDFGPRTRPPAEILASQIVKGQTKPSKVSGDSNRLLEPIQNVPNELTSYARSHTVPEVFRDARDGQSFQKEAHFKFGSDENTVESLYAKDFAPASMATTTGPTFYVPPSAGNLLQNDPEYFKFGTPSSKADFMFRTMPDPTDANGKTTMEKNMEKRHTDSVVFSYDVNRHTDDRQKSLSHGDYKSPPSSFQVMQPRKAPTVEFDYLQTNDALPYQGLPQRSEAKNNFFASFMHGQHAMERRKQRKDDCRERSDETRTTHFTVGYAGPDFETETIRKYDGQSRNDQHVMPAGKTETIPDEKFSHFGMSQNTSDMKAADPYVTNSKESLKARNLYTAAKNESAYQTSIMKSDFNPLAYRRMTDFQNRTIEKYETLLEKPIERSHFFHTDNSGRDNFITTTMSDFLKPDTMTGQKFLAAR